jgi:hypothetical protein
MRALVQAMWAVFAPAGPRSRISRECVAALTRHSCCKPPSHHHRTTMATQARCSIRQKVLRTPYWRTSTSEPCRATSKRTASWRRRCTMPPPPNERRKCGRRMRACSSLTRSGHALHAGCSSRRLTATTKSCAGARHDPRAAPLRKLGPLAAVATNGIGTRANRLARASRVSHKTSARFTFVAGSGCCYCYC